MKEEIEVSEEWVVPAMQVFVEVDGVLSSNHLLFPTLALLHHCHLPPVQVQPKNYPSIQSLTISMQSIIKKRRAKMG